jgi:4'-phosphopantetheinyl transferase
LAGLGGVNQTGADMALNVTVWQIDLAEPDADGAAATVLTPAETARAARFARPQDQRRFVIGRGALRGLLGQALATAPPDLALAESDNGKPFVPGAPLRFNLSHSHDWALLAIGPAIEIGIDLEAIAPPEPGLAERFFAPEEAEALARLRAEELAIAFTRVWTRKEAVVKAIGAGLRAPLDGFVVSDAAALMSRLARCDFDPPLALQLQIHDCPAPDGFLASLAIAAGDAAVTLEVRCLASVRALLMG